jgi:apolipoprotein N-acyltransferase
MRIVRFILATLAFVVLSAVILVIGNNIGINGSFEWDTFGESFGIFGGIGSFLALLGVVAAFGLAFFFMLSLARANKNSAAAGTGVAFMAIALIVGALWVRVDIGFFGGIGPILIYLVYAAAATAIIGAILGVRSFTRRAANPAAPTT